MHHLESTFRSLRLSSSRQFHKNNRSDSNNHSFEIPSLRYLDSVKSKEKDEKVYFESLSKCSPVNYPPKFSSIPQYVQILTKNISAEYYEAVINGWKSNWNLPDNGWHYYERSGNGLVIKNMDFSKDPWSSHLVEIEGCDRLCFVTFCDDDVLVVCGADVPYSGQIRSFGYFGSFLLSYASILTPMDTNILRCIMEGEQKNFFNLESTYLNPESLDSSIVPFNESQEKAVLNLRPFFDIIQGPPGTGKSTTIWHIINSRIKPGSQCLITCTRNQAIDSAVSKVKSFGVLVIGRDERLGEEAKKYTLTGKLSTDKEMVHWNDIQEKFKNLLAKCKQFIHDIWINYQKKMPNLLYLEIKSRDFEDGSRNGKLLWAIAFKGVLVRRMLQKLGMENMIKLWLRFLSKANTKLNILKNAVKEYRTKDILMNTRVYLCTIDSTSSMERYLSLHGVNLSLDTCIVDEAGCVLESSIPILFKFNPKNLVLIGDHLQLQPFSSVQSDYGNPTNHTQSLMERSIKNGASTWFLDTQYRMHPDICSVVSNLFYDQKLKTGKRMDRGVSFKKACSWVDCKSREEQHKGRGYSNLAEAEVVTLQAKLILEECDPGSIIYIVTFYNKQRQTILQFFENDEILKKVLGKTVYVLSIDACQGSEADFVIISTVRTNAVGKFMEDKRRLCVALSRAKHACVIVGDSDNMLKRGGNQWKEIVTNYSLGKLANGMNEIQDDYILSLELALEELNIAKEGFAGKLKCDSDLLIALSIEEEQERNLLLSIKLTYATQNVPDLSDELINNFRDQDILEARDRQFSLSLSSESSRNQAEKIQRNVLHNQNACIPSSSKSGSNSQMKILPVAERNECNSCLEKNMGKYFFICDHAYCDNCIRELCRVALTDRKYIPVRCCKTAIPMEILRICYTEKDMKKYIDFLEEINNPKAIEVSCDIKMSEVINTEGWKICQKCGAVVARESGCIHMTCVCRNEFCYTCMKIWKTCTCELYPVAELNAILDNRAIPRNEQDRNQLQNVLMNYYGHDHNWIFHGGSQGQCSQCLWNMPSFTMRCETCRETRCRRCTFNL